VKTFNTTFAADIISPVIDGERTDAFIAGKNGYAVSVASEIVKSVGFNPVVAGDLSISRTLERMQLRLIQIALRIQLVGGMEDPSQLIDSGLLKNNTMKDHLKSFLALCVLITICMLLLASYSGN